LDAAGLANNTRECHVVNRNATETARAVVVSRGLIKHAWLKLHLSQIIFYLTQLIDKICEATKDKKQYIQMTTFISLVTTSLKPPFYNDIIKIIPNPTKKRGMLLIRGSREQKDVMDLKRWSRSESIYRKKTIVRPITQHFNVIVR
jgi:hypothetical protein